MYPFLIALIAILAALFLFCAFRLIGAVFLRKHLVIQDRILDIQGEKTEKTPLQTARKKAKKVNKSTAAAKTKKQLEKLESELYDVGIRIPVREFLAVWIAAALGLPLILGLLGVNVLICCAIIFLCAAGPIILLKLRKKKRREELNGQLVEAISVLCNALRAGHSFQQAMSSIAEEMNGPIAEEFGRVFRETQHGMTMQDSMERMIDRVESDDLEMLCTAILIQREIGGNLAEVLENIAGTVQSRLALKAEIKTRTASGRLSGYLVGALPIVLLIAISVINPEYSSTLYTTQLGHILLIVGGVMEVIGFLVIKKIITVKY